ncbi:MAG: hypothetical protein NVSMB24_04880 [Mucilaginibacter sp.]
MVDSRLNKKKLPDSFGSVFIYANVFVKNSTKHIYNSYLKRVYILKKEFDAGADNF